MRGEQMQDIPVVIFCGGEGTRMRGGTLTKKELVEIGGRPIIWHVRWATRPTSSSATSSTTRP
jgi:molybdopterin-guanine dinucleotide biosynthesis protein A